MYAYFLSLISGKEDNGGIKRALLEVIASGVVTRPQDVERYAACTFFASVPAQQDENDTDAVIKKTVKFLVENEFVRLQKCDNKKADENKENNGETEEVSLKRNKSKVLNQQQHITSQYRLGITKEPRYPSTYSLSCLKATVSFPL